MADIVDMNGKPYGSPGYTYDSTRYKECNVLQELGERGRDAYLANSRFHEDKLNHWVPVFVYDEFQPGGKDNIILKECPYLGKARSAAPSWIMYKSFNEDPIISRNSPSDIRSARIHGHVYMVPPKVLLSLDVMFENGDVNQRDKMYVFLKDQHYKSKEGYVNPSIQVITYTMKKDFWRGVHLEVAPRVVTSDYRTYYEYLVKETPDNTLDDTLNLPSLFNQS